MVLFQGGTVYNWKFGKEKQHSWDVWIKAGLDRELTGTGKFIED